jgi:hypothetical protein
MNEIDKFCIEHLFYLLIAGFFGIGILLFTLETLGGYLVGSVMIFGSYMFWRIVLNGFKGRIE